MKGETISEVATALRYKGEKSQRPISEGLGTKPFPLAEGFIAEVLPEQLMSLHVPRLEVRGDKIEGYQRPVSRRHVTNIQRTLEQGKEVPPILVSIYDSKAWLTDGQHRALGAVAARVPIAAVVQKRTMLEQIGLFANQARARRPSSDLLILRGSGPYEEYIQDAVTDPKKQHPWSKLVASKAGDPRRVSPTTTRRMLYAYVGLTTNYSPSKSVEDRWDENAANELGVLFGIFGNRESNPHAFSSTGAQGIALAAAYAIRRQGSDPEDIDRWIRWMPKFPFTNFAYIKSPPELADRLLAHWNKRLSEDKRVYRI